MDSTICRALWYARWVSSTTKGWLKETWSLCKRSWQVSGFVADVPEDSNKYKYKTVKSMITLIKQCGALNFLFFMTHIRYFTLELQYCCLDCIQPHFFSWGQTSKYNQPTDAGTHFYFILFFFLAVQAFGYGIDTSIKKETIAKMLFFTFAVENKVSFLNTNYAL